MIVAAIVYLLALAAIVGALARKPHQVSGPMFAFVVVSMVVSGLVLAAGRL